MKEREIPEAIAITGLALRFPGASDPETFWQRLCQGEESITHFSDDTLRAAGVPESLLSDPSYVKSGFVLDDVETIDAEFFGLSPSEAEVLDPQHRTFLECAWEALEDAGYDPETCDRSIGVFAGVFMSTYLYNNLAKNPRAWRLGEVLLRHGNEKDYLATRVSYKFNLKGPSVTVQCACSSSLVAVHLACQSLLSGECDMALAGGVSIRVPHSLGYSWRPGDIVSPDGHCRAFNADASGTVFGHGGGLVLLKMLPDAVADGDRIYAIVRGSAINNDGALKVGYTAPSIDGQAEVIAEALGVAEVDPESITYVEAHGTGTSLGDPIECAALTRAFRERTERVGYCALGSVKTNIGHLSAASGVAGLIKTALMLQHREIPPSLHFERPNPKIDFETSPFYVNAALRPWESDTPRRAGLSSFGMGGTNAHAILEEAPQAHPSGASRSHQLLVVSARTSAALAVAKDRLAAYLEAKPDLALADVAFTLKLGRRAFAHRAAVVCRDRNGALAALTEEIPGLLGSVHDGAHHSVVFLFPGQGAQYPQMGRELYRTESGYRREIDRCAEILRPHLGLDLRAILYPEDDPTAAERLTQTSLAQPALFMTEYALARLLIDWVGEPSAMVGHSVGELVAACLAGVFSLEDALYLVAVRGRLMQSMAPGAMLSVSLPVAAVDPLLSAELALAAVNAPQLVTIAGSESAVAALEEELRYREVGYRRLHTSHAFHSPAMQPAADAFAGEARRVALMPPKIPVLSNLSGDWLTREQATAPHYWGQQLRQTVHFSEGVSRLLDTGEAAFLELGPGRTLSSLLRQHENFRGRPIISTLRRPKDAGSDTASILEAVARLWLAGVEVAGEALFAGQERRRIRLPTYPFERRRYWVEPAESQLPEVVEAPRVDAGWLVYADRAGFGEHFMTALRETGEEVTAVPADTEDVRPVFEALSEAGQMPGRAVHLQSLDLDETEADPRPGFASLVDLVERWAPQTATDRRRELTVVTRGATAVGTASGNQGLVAGLCRALAARNGALFEIRHVDLEPEARAGSEGFAATAERLCDELRTGLVCSATTDEAEAGEAEAGYRRPDLASTYVAPSHPLEERLVEIWGELLGVERIGVQDSFYELGGHSLLATRLVSRLHDVLGIRLSVAEILERETIAELAQALAESSPELCEPEAVVSPMARVSAIPRLDRDGEAFPLSFAQQRLWFLEQLEPGTAAYHMPQALRLTGALDLTALEAAIGALERRQETLRFAFAEGAGEPVQILCPPCLVGHALVDLTALDAAQRDPEARRWVRAEILRPMDLARAPLWRVLLVRLADREWILLVVFHHLLADGWSLGVAVREVAALYRAAKEGRSAGLPKLGIQYVDFAHWQRHHLRGERLEELLKFWRTRLGDEPPSLDLPLDRPRQATQSYRGRHLGFRLSRAQNEGLATLHRSGEATLFMVLLAAVDLLLYRYTGQRDLTVGTPVAGRGRVELEGLIGCFVNTLVLRADLGGDPSFRQILARVRQVALEAYAHQDLPFETLVEHLRPSRDLSRSPLFQVMVLLQNLPGEPLDLPGLEVEPWEPERATARFELSLYFTETASGIAGTCEYSAGLFDATTMRRLLGHFDRLLAGALSAPDDPLSRLSLLTAGERFQLLEAWNDTAAGLPVAATLPALIDAQIVLRGESLAVVGGGMSLSYHDLGERARHLARRLRQLGVRPEVRVGVALPRSPELLVALIAIHRAGGTYVPLDPRLPEARLRQMLEDSGARLLVTIEQLVERFPGPALRHICLDTPADATLTVGESGLGNIDGRDLDGRTLAYIIYTSGSTGQPKGVEVPHRAVVNFLLSMRRRLGFAAGDHLLAVTTLSFDISVLELFLPLVSGGTVEVVDEATAGDALRLAGDLEQAAGTATFMQATPATWRLLVEAGWPGDSGLTLLCGGESLPWDLAEDLLERSRELWNVYGPTETTVWSSMSRILPDIRRITLGRPLDNTSLYVLDPYLRPVPVGVWGGLYIDGTGLARGYHDLPARSAEAFLPNPFPGASGTRMYFTGDLARCLASGEVEYLGRADFQVKVRGFRIELGEIEAALLTHPDVAAAVAVARDQGRGDQRLAAFVVPEEGTKPEAGTLRRYLAAKLPEYMLPTVFQTLEALPLNASGKVDRRALPASEDTSARQNTPRTAPRTALEKQLAAIWSEVLEREDIGIEDSFFDLGGHSMAATRLVFKLREHLGVELPVRLLFQVPTIAELARRIVSRSTGEARSRKASDDAAPSFDAGRETALDAEIRPPVDGAWTAEGRELFLTGATGFVGAFLLYELLARTDATVSCLVRAPDATAGLERIRDNFAAYRLPAEMLERRVHVVTGDLAEPCCGLSAHDFEDLAKRLDGIYHNGARVNFVLPYEELKTTNVDGTREILRLACRGRIKPVHFVSTFGAVDPTAYGDNSVVLETDPVGRHQGLTLGYTLSKWVGERLVREAGSRGLPIGIYRLGRIVGHSQTGAGKADDFLWRALRSFTQLQAAPAIDLDVDMTPINYAAGALVHLSRQRELAGRCFHLMHPRPIAFERLVEHLEELGYPISRIPYDTWRERLLAQARESEQLALYPLVALFAADGAVDEGGSLSFDTRRAEEGLAGSGIVCPTIDKKLLSAWLTHFIEQSLWEPPPGVVVSPDSGSISP